MSGREVRDCNGMVIGQKLLNRPNGVLWLWLQKILDTELMMYVSGEIGDPDKPPTTIDIG